MLTTGPIIICAALCAVMLVCMEAGYRLGRRRRIAEGESDARNLIYGAIFALLGLLLGFSFGGSMDRLELRRALAVKEANAINDAYDYIDVLPLAHQAEMRALFRDYVDARLKVYDDADASRDIGPADAVVKALQKDLWAAGIRAKAEDKSLDTSRLFLPALNELDDYTRARTLALQTHLPALILVLLITTALLSGLTAGYAMSKSERRSLVHGFFYAFAVSLTIYTVLDIDNPRRGWIRLNAAEQILKDLRNEI